MLQYPPRKKNSRDFWVVKETAAGAWISVAEWPQGLQLREGYHPGKTNECHLKINGRSRCRPYWNGSLRRKHVNFHGELFSYTTVGGSYTTVDGRNPASQLSWVVDPILHAGFYTSQVPGGFSDFFYDHYHWCTGIAWNPCLRIPMITNQ